MEDLEVYVEDYLSFPAFSNFLPCLLYLTHLDPLSPSSLLACKNPTGNPFGISLAYFHFTTPTPFDCRRIGKRESWRNRNDENATATGSHLDAGPGSSVSFSSQSGHSPTTFRSLADASYTCRVSANEQLGNGQSNLVCLGHI